jgi:phage/plasmid-associated DNA primase
MPATPRVEGYNDNCLVGTFRDIGNCTNTVTQSLSYTRWCSKCHAEYEADGLYLRIANVDFDPEAKSCPKISKLLDNMFLPEQKEMVLSILGAIISGRKAQYILCLSGSGRNGKSLLREFLEALMMEMMTTEKLESLNREFLNTAFVGKRLTWQTELDSSRHVIDQLKDVTGGTTINIRRKYIDGERPCQLQMVVISDTNNPPSFGNLVAIRERLRFVDMPHAFVKKLSEPRNPKEILLDPELSDNWESEIPAFFNMILPYAQYYFEHGRLQYDMPDSIELIAKKANIVSEFIEDCCEQDSIKNTDLRKLHRHFNKYADDKNVGGLDESQFRYKLFHDCWFAVKGRIVYGLVLKEFRNMESFETMPKNVPTTVYP